MADVLKNEWVLILGGSSGLGYASALKLASEGYHICVVHRDMRGEMVNIQPRFDEIIKQGVKLLSFNGDVLQSDFRQKVLASIKTETGTGKIKLLLHSIAKGSLKPMFSQESNHLSHEDFMLTLDAMAVNAFDWVTEALRENLLGEGSRIVGLTSEGSTRPFIGYGAVAAAKAALESIFRSFAVELASLGITSNTIQAGVTNTRAMRMIPGSETIMDIAGKRNPNNRITTPEDVANALSLLIKPEANWINGTTLVVDGGEFIQ